MAQQTKLTDYFSKRRQYKSPAAKRQKLVDETVADNLSFKSLDINPVSSASATPDVTLAFVADSLLHSRKKRKGAISDRVAALSDASTCKADAAAAAKSSPARRQLDFTAKGRRKPANTAEPSVTLPTTAPVQSEKTSAVAIAKSVDSAAQISHVKKGDYSKPPNADCSVLPPTETAAPAVAPKEVQLEIIKPTISLSAKPAAAATPVKTLSPSKQNLSPKKIKQRLGKVTNLQQLRDRLAKFSDVASKLNEQVNATEEAKHAAASEAQAGGLSLVAEASSSKLASPTKTKQQEIAAERFQHLSTLLPLQHHKLYDVFSGADTIVQRLFNRQEMITFDKLKRAIEQMCSKRFDTNLLGQLKTIYPEAYKLELISCSSKFVSPGAKEKIELVITPNLEEDIKNYADIVASLQPSPTKTAAESANVHAVNEMFDDLSVMASPRAPGRNGNTGAGPFMSPPTPLKVPRILRTPCKTPPPEPKPQSPQKAGATNVLTASRLICRRNIFRHNLFEWLKAKHREFLKQLNPPIVLSESEDAALQHWHSGFVDYLATIPGIPVAEIPQPQKQKETFTAQKMLEKANEFFMPEQVKRALEFTIAQNSNADSILAKPIPSKTPTSSKGISEALLAKIKAKESAKEKLDMLRNPALENERMMYGRLPEIVRIINTYFIQKGKNALSTTEVVDMITTSSRSHLSKEDVNCHLQLLKQLPSKWLKEVKISSGSFLKIDSSKSMNALLAEIDGQSPK